MIDLTSVEHALCVAEHLSFRRAAKVLGIRQSAISRRIQVLEDELGVSLFERHSSGVRLTAAGESFLSGASDALVELRFAVRRAEEAGRGARGFLRLGLSSSLASGAVHDLLRHYRDQHPDVVLHFIEGSTRDHVARVNERGLDLAFVCGSPSTPDCDRLQLGMERLYATLPAEHALAALPVVEWDSLIEERFIARQEDIAPDFLTAARVRHGKGADSVGIERLSVGRDSLMHLVSMGFGLVLSTASAITVPFPGIVFRPIGPPDNAIALCALWLPGNDNPALRRFVSLARTYAASTAV